MGDQFLHQLLDWLILGKLACYLVETSDGAGFCFCFKNLIVVVIQINWHVFMIVSAFFCPCTSKKKTKLISFYQGKGTRNTNSRRSILIKLLREGCIKTKEGFFFPSLSHRLSKWTEPCIKTREDELRFFSLSHRLSKWKERSCRNQQIIKWGK